METVELRLTAHQFNFVIDVLQDLAREAVRGDPTKVGYRANVQREANDLVDVMLQQRMGL
jgi:hypothetical protein